MFVPADVESSCMSGGARSARMSEQTTHAAASRMPTPPTMSVGRHPIHVPSAPPHNVPRGRVPIRKSWLVALTRPWR